ncbi:MAG TPA: response regulator [Verrucomicrobiales bacterium]|jgi:CheY-like chemotaxis protein|nr:response regulator [Verrucomicrobiales bacterium]
MQGKPTVLLVEDDDGHAFLLKSSLRKAGFQNNVRRFSDGQEILDFLNKITIGSDPLSIVILLDIRMPRLDGVEVLKQIREDQRFTDMPVIMVTTTDDPGEMHRCMQLGCDAFLVKPMDWKQFTTRLSALAGFFSRGHRQNETSGEDL